MNKLTLEYFIPLCANIYFWAVIIAIILNIIYSYSDEYERVKEIRIQKGKFPLGITHENVRAWVLFILSMYYR